MNNKILFAWSGGKDSALALYHLQHTKQAKNIIALMTTVNKDYKRISIHGVRNSLLLKQTKSLGYPLSQVEITKKSTHERYEQEMRKVLDKYAKLGVTTVGFGDIYLKNLRKYREKKLAQINMTALFPIWQKDTTKLANNFIKLGFKAIITCIDHRKLGKKFVGREFDKQFLADLPASVDPCGENGEFHCFAYDGPIFKQPINCKRGIIVLRHKHFYYCDLIPT